MNDPSVEDALSRIASTKQRDRREGLQELKRILSRRNQRPDLRDRAYHALFEVLFRLAINEKANWVRYTKAGRGLAASTLADCAEVTRLAVEAGVKDLRAKTVRAILDHVIEILPIPEDNGFCEPLVTDYLRALKTILQYAPHPSHLSEDQWHQLVLFCHSGIARQSQEAGEPDSFYLEAFAAQKARQTDRPRRSIVDAHRTESAAVRPSLDDLGFVRRSSSGWTSPNSSSAVTPITKSFKETRVQATQTNHIVNDLMACLHYLLRVPHAPVMSTAKASLDIILEFLNSITPLSQLQGQEKAFAGIKILLAAAATEDTDLAFNAYERLVSSIRRLWHSKANDLLKEQMLGVLLIGVPFLERLKESMSQGLESLLKVLITEYSKRHTRDLLKLDDVDFSLATFEPDDVGVFGTFRVSTGSGRAEQSSAILIITSKLLALTNESVRLGDSDLEARVEESALAQRKRQKITDRVEEFMDSILSCTASEQLPRIQILTFLCAIGTLSSSSFRKGVEITQLLLSAESSPLSAWVMCALANLACQRHAQNAVSTETWLQIWHLGFRKLSNPATSRGACHMLTMLMESQLINFKHVNQTLDTMLSSLEFNGPAEVDECSARLWRQIIEFKAKHTPSSTGIAADSMFRWLCIRWKPSVFLASQSDPLPGHRASPQALLYMISCIKGPIIYPNSSQTTNGLASLALAQMRVILDLPLTNFLLLKPDSSEPTSHSRAPPQTSSISLSETQVHSLMADFAEFLSSETTTILEVLESKEGNLRKVSTGHVYVIATLCMVGFWTSTHCKSFLAVSASLKSRCQELRSSLARLLVKEAGTGSASNGLLDALGPLVHLTQEVSQIEESLLLMTRDFDSTFWNKVQNQATEVDTGADAMDLAEGDSSQSHIRGDLEDGESTIDWMSSSHSCSARHMQLTLRFCYWSLQQERSDPALACQEMVDILLSKDSAEFLLCRPFLQELLASAKILDISQKSESLLSYVGTHVLQSYQHERSEVAMGVCLDILSYFTPTLTTLENDAAADLALQVYQWFVTIAIGKKIASPHTHACVADLLQKVIVSNPNYGRDLSLPSPKDVLLSVLEDGRASVKYHVGMKLSQVFRSFVLSEHDEILEDTLDHLQMDVDWLEGCAIRMFILSHLGSQWRALIRRCLFALTEAPYLVPAVAKYSQRSIHMLASALGLADSAELFRLFAAQITYSWLESRPLTALPYFIFGYPELKSMIYDAQDEVVAQVLMKGREEDARNISTVLSSSYESLVLAAFGKTAAYSVARDAAINPASDPQAADAVNRLRKAVGKDTFAKLLVERLQEIIAFMFNLVDRDESLLKGLKKYNYKAAQSAYQTIVSTCSSSSSGHAASAQQPSFKASYLVDQLEYVCERAGFDDAKQIWTPVLYCYVFRTLISNIHDALGPLQSVTVIKRIRVLVSLAGPVALQDYPMDMVLHAMRPFLVNAHCSEDAIGIVRYLMTNGASYLAGRRRYLTSFVLATLVSLRHFTDLPQDSMTQDSCYQATMANAEAFRTWLSGFALELEPSAESESSLQNQQTLLTAAQQIRSVVTPGRATPEGELLKALVDDDVSCSGVVIPAYREAVIRMLQTNFCLPPNPEDDILYDGSEAVRCVSAVWRSLGTATKNNAYGLWASRVIGRAYGANGYVCPDISREALLDPTAREKMRSSRYVTSESRFAILSTLQEHLFCDNPVDIGALERTLQSIASSTEQDESTLDCMHELDESLTHSLSWKPYSVPRIRSKATEQPELADIPVGDQKSPPAGWPADGMFSSTHFLKGESQSKLSKWARQVCLSLIQHVRQDSFLTEILHAIQHAEAIAVGVFPYVVHLVLLAEYDRSSSPRNALSSAFMEIFTTWRDSALPQADVIIELLLYLRTQQIPNEKSIRDRRSWLDIDYKLAAEVAVRCNKFKTALLFLELEHADATDRRIKRASAVTASLPAELLKSIFRGLDDKDSYLGLEQAPTLKAFVDYSQFEGAGFKSLSLLSAFRDSEILRGAPSRAVEFSLYKVLDRLDLNGLSAPVLSGISEPDTEIRTIMFESARKLEKWDIPSPAERPDPSSEVFRCFQEIYDENLPPRIHASVNHSFASILSLLNKPRRSSMELRAAHQALATLSEIEDIFCAQGTIRLHRKWAQMQKRESWMLTSSLDSSKNILSSRRTLFSVLSKSQNLQNIVKVNASTVRGLEARALLSSASLIRRHAAFQSCLNIAAQLDGLIEPCKDLGVHIEAASQFEASNVLWDQNEMSSSIRIVRHILEHVNLEAQEIPVHRSVLLARLGQHVSEARLERPDQIMKNYLLPAIAALSEDLTGTERGQVYHEFAIFCDKQLQNTENTEDLHRAQRMKERKEAEVQELEKMLKSKDSQGRERDNLKSLRNKAKQWLEIDNRELERLRDSRQQLLKQSLENYLLSLQASDSSDTDALRFTALWLEHSDAPEANKAAKLVSSIASRKFASLMNQWTSRLMDTSSPFQQILSELVLRICTDHPYHAMYHVFASSNSKGGKDQTALSRYSAARKIASKLKSDARTAATWQAIHGSCYNFVKFAQEKPDDGTLRRSTRIALKASSAGQRLEHDAKKFNTPPPTLRLELRASGDYSDVPLLARFQSEYTIASGISMPKILTAIGTDGRRYKQLFKSGNDDLRQDAIMEQVFEQVSDLLKSQRETRQRDLGIRTYKVMPLTATSGIIEFVSNTIPLSDYLVPAHQKYHPSDLKNNACRKLIQEAQSRPNDVRVSVFRQVSAKFQPVLRYFFMERFEHPDDWYARRTAYTRSTAAISILGHILGLGDRHGHNILLDEITGEVVHIDLGIAFEQGRVLPVPEVVPFRLTRDLVDGMGITGTEGVFRRCCEFTLDALRKEAGSIMTILDVLRYDPLYSWSLSPLRLKRLQDQDDQEAEPFAAVQKLAPIREKTDEQGEADRALTVVGKKLSKTLSVSATVNELIQQATDERNLALLYCGWSAYA